MNPRKRMRLRMAARAANRAKKDATTVDVSPPVKKAETTAPPVSAIPIEPSPVPERKTETKKGTSVYDKHKVSSTVAPPKQNASKKASGTKKKK